MLPTLRDERDAPLRARKSVASLMHTPCRPRIPFVVTHPDPESQVRQQDQVFVLVCRKSVFRLKKQALAIDLEGAGRLHDPSAVEQVKSMQDQASWQSGMTPKDPTLADLHRRIAQLEAVKG